MSARLDSLLQTYREEHGPRCSHGTLRDRPLTVGCAGVRTRCACCGSGFCGVASNDSPMPTTCRPCREPSDA